MMMMMMMMMMMIQSEQERCGDKNGDVTAYSKPLN